MVGQSTNHAWLQQRTEAALEPELPICEPHHHLWDLRSGATQPRYLLEEMLADLGGGHNIVSTVFIECGAMFRADGPEEMKCVGETEFVKRHCRHVGIRRLRPHAHCRRDHRDMRSQDR